MGTEPTIRHGRIDVVPVSTATLFWTLTEGPPPGDQDPAGEEAVQTPSRSPAGTAHMPLKDAGVPGALPSAHGGCSVPTRPRERLSQPITATADTMDSGPNSGGYVSPPSLELSEDRAGPVTSGKAGAPEDRDSPLSSPQHRALPTGSWSRRLTAPIPPDTGPPEGVCAQHCPACGLVWGPALAGGPGPGPGAGMGFQADLCHQLCVARLLGMWAAGARDRTAEPEAGGLCRGGSPRGPGLRRPVRARAPRDKPCPHAGLDVPLR